MASLFLFALALLWQPTFERHTVSSPGAEIRGAAVLAPSQIVTWGADLREWSVPSLRWDRLALGPFGEGGCTVDLNKDGRKELILARGPGLGSLVRLEGPRWREEPIDTAVEMHDCLEATLFGRRGVLIIHRGIQVRFYERSADGKWSSRDIYSIYTPSYQGGLAVVDVNSDGRPDILCGNYWIQSPAAFHLPWRLFAINTWSEVEESATFALATLSNSRVAVAQGHMSPARIATLRKPADPKQQWPSTALAESLHPAYPHALAVWNSLLLAGERNGAASRLFLIDTKTLQATILREGAPISTILPVGTRGFVTAGSGEVTLWTQSSRK